MQQYLLEPDNVVPFHYLVPIKSLGEPVQYVANLIILYRAQCVNFKTELLMLRANSVKGIHLLIG